MRRIESPYATAERKRNRESYPLYDLFFLYASVYKTTRRQNEYLHNRVVAVTIEKKKENNSLLRLHTMKTILFFLIAFLLISSKIIFSKLSVEILIYSSKRIQ
jgi:uncharacterized membrane protein YqjE